jgi:ABC-2 type transport system ATP-binding protein
MLTAESINKKFNKHHVLDGVSLQAQSGEIIGIAGINGSGKSTLLSVLTGLIKPDGGQVSIEGESLSPKALKQWLGYVPQENSLFDTISAWDNIKLWAAAYKTDWKNALPFLFPESEGITEDEEKRFLYKKTALLSGGMKKRLSIAVSLMHNPKYLIMDEPTAGLDIGFRYTLSETIKQLRAREKCVIFTSHQTEELLLCDRIYILRGGLFVYAGSPQIISNGTEDLYALISGKTPHGTKVC